MNTETTNKTIESIENEQTHTLTISQAVDMVRAQRSKTEFFVYAKVGFDVPVSVTSRSDKQHYEGAIPVSRTALLEFLSGMSSRFRMTSARVTVAVHSSNTYSAFYLC